MKKLIAPLVLFIFASSVSAAELGKRGKKEYMGACGERDAGLIYAITNGSNVASCDAAQAVGTERIYCSCASDGVGGYAWTLFDTALGGGDLSAYVLLAGDADGQTIQGQTGSDKARVVIDEGDYVDTIRIVGPGADPAYISVQGGQVDIIPPGNNGAITATGSYISFALGDGYLSLYVDGSVESVVTAYRVVTSQTPPTNANDPCTAGDTIDTASFHYYCPSENTWVRVAMATWP